MSPSTFPAGMDFFFAVYLFSSLPNTLVTVYRSVCTVRKREDTGQVDKIQVGAQNSCSNLRDLSCNANYAGL